MHDAQSDADFMGRRDFLKALAATAAGVTAARANEAPKLEFWDSHGHLNSQFPEEWVDTLAERMQAENVTKASLTGVGLLSDHEDTDVLRAYEKYPKLFMPFVCNFDPNDPKSVDYVRHQLNNGPWRGVGELYLDTTDTVNANIPLRDGTWRKHPYPVPKEKSNSPVLRQIFDLCGEKGVPAFIHCERLSFLCEVLPRHRHTRFIAAHCDYRCRLEDVRRMLEGHANVWCDVGAVMRQAGYKRPPTAEALAVRDQWRKLMTDFPDRICLGTDTYSWKALAADFYRHAHEVFREIIAPLGPERAARIAKLNYQRLMESAGKNK